MSIFNGIGKGNVVEVKFKNITDMVKERKTGGKLEFLSDYEVGCNVQAIVLGGQFVVIDKSEGKKPDENYIEVDNHFDGGTLEIYEPMIESISTVDVANKFYSEDHGVLMIQVDNKIYINGILLEDYTESHLDEKEKNLLTKFITFMEKYMVAKVFDDSLEAADTDSK